VTPLGENSNDDQAAMLIDNLYRHEEAIDNLKGRNGKFQLDCQEMGATFVEKSGRNTSEPTFIMLTLKAISTHPFIKSSGSL
jgi:hypothetical protein